MSQNIQQIFTASPASSMQPTDLLYLGRSPYNTSDDFAITFANFVASIGTATPTPSTIAEWDANNNFSANNFISSFQSIVSAASTTTLTVASPYATQVIGTTTQTVQMPLVSTLPLNTPYLIINSSTGLLTVTSSGGNTIQVIPPGSTMQLISISQSGTSAASWLIIRLSASGGPTNQFTSSNVPINTVSLSTGVIANVTSITLGAGQWNIFGNVSFFGGSTTTVSLLKGWASTTSASDPGSPNYNTAIPPGTPFAVSPYGFNVPYIRVSLASTTTVYLSVQAAFAVSTCTVGGVISATLINY